MKLEIPEVWLLINILHEVCYGIPVPDFEKIIGEKRSVIDFMNRIIASEGKTHDFTFSVSELHKLRSSFQEVCKEIDDWEFPIRIGISKEEAIKILDKII